MMAVRPPARAGVAARVTSPKPQFARSGAILPMVHTRPTPPCHLYSSSRWLARGWEHTEVLGGFVPHVNELTVRFV
jgi:hypothetical protein